PEQAEGKSQAVGPAADIYSLGTILYELLTGRPPFQAESTLGILLLVRTEEPVPPVRLRPGMPRDLETICLKCLQKEPRRRYANAGALAEDLGRFRAGRPVRARPVRRAGRLWRWGRRTPLVASLAAALFLVLAAGLAGATSQWLRAEAKASAEASARREADDKSKELEINLYYQLIAL